MKPLLRILVILLSIVIVIIALLPPEKTDKAAAVASPAETAAPAPAATAVPNSQKLIRDLLGGAAIDSGNQAKEKISEVNRLRKKEFEENGL